MFKRTRLCSSFLATLYSFKRIILPLIYRTECVLILTWEVVRFKSRIACAFTTRMPGQEGDSYLPYAVTFPPRNKTRHSIALSMQNPSSPIAITTLGSSRELCVAVASLILRGRKGRSAESSACRSAGKGRRLGEAREDVAEAAAWYSRVRYEVTAEGSMRRLGARGFELSVCLD